MNEVRAKLVEKIKRTSLVESFRFVTDEKINFIPGQFLKVIFDENNKDNNEVNKYLSFSSSPTKDYIEVTKKLSKSNFSQKLNNLKKEDAVLLQAPLGNCIFKDDYKKIGFLIGGIGITPVISIIEYIVEKKINTDIRLFYSNRTQEDIAFREELVYWQNINNNLKVFYTLTESKCKDDACIFGRINKELLIDKAEDYRERIFFIFGPPKMVEAMNSLCRETGCKKENIITEIFIGY